VLQCNLAEQKNQKRKEMKRKSLQFKLQEIAKIGILRTYSREEAIKFAQQSYPDDSDFTAKQIVQTEDAYNRGLILCVFRAYDEKVESVNTAYVSQLTKSLADFVTNIVYIINFE